MYFHGINFKYLVDQYPFLNPEAHVSSKGRAQIKDREHLIEKLGFEPVHLLESSPTYPIKKCLKECFSFGHMILSFRKLQEPVWQISPHEIGVAYLDMRSSYLIFIRQQELRRQLKRFFPKSPIIYVNWK